MNPDMVVGLAMIAVSIAGLLIGSVTTWLLLTRPGSIDAEQPGDRCDECGTSIDSTCPHGRSLCTECAPGSCDECLTDLRCQGVLSQYVTGTFPTIPGGAA